MTAARYSSRRRSLRLPAAACVACAVVGFTIGMAGSFIKPGPWFGAADAFERVQRVEPGHVLVADDGTAALVMADSVRHYGPPPMARGVVVFVRQRHGRHAAIAECYSGGAIQIGDSTTTWTSKATGVEDLVARALCHGHAHLQPPPAGGTA